jgi:hypothetical protein
MCPVLIADGMLVLISDSMHMLACAASCQARGKSLSNFEVESGENVCLPMRRMEFRVSSAQITLARDQDAVEADINAFKLSGHSSDPDVWDPVGKAPEEIATWCVEYERNRRKMAKRRRQGTAGIYRARTESCLY